MFSIYSAEKMKVLASNACISQIDHASVKFLSTCADIDRSSHFSDVAQMVEQRICNTTVGSSSLSIGAIYCRFAKLVRHRTLTPVFGRSNRSSATIKKIAG